MLRPLLASLVLTFALICSGPARAAILTPSIAISAQILFFATEVEAQAHCPKDEVVLNFRSGIYHEKGMRWHGRTKDGAYVCRNEANAAGYRDTRNGQ